MHYPLNTSNKASAQWVSSSLSLSLSFNIRNDQLFKVGYCCGFIGPVAFNVRNVPIWWKTFILKLRQAFGSHTLYINCIGRNLQDMAQEETAVICLFFHQYQLFSSFLLHFPISRRDNFHCSVVPVDD